LFPEKRREQVPDQRENALPVTGSIADSCLIIKHSARSISAGKKGIVSSRRINIFFFSSFLKNNRLENSECR